MTTSNREIAEEFVTDLRETSYGLHGEEYDLTRKEAVDAIATALDEAEARGIEEGYKKAAKEMANEHTRK